MRHVWLTLVLLTLTARGALAQQVRAGDYADRHYFGQLQFDFVRLNTNGRFVFMTEGCSPIQYGAGRCQVKTDSLVLQFDEWPRLTWAMPPAPPAQPVRLIDLMDGQPLPGVVLFNRRHQTATSTDSLVWASWPAQTQLGDTLIISYIGANSARHVVVDFNPTQIALANSEYLSSGRRMAWSISNFHKSMERVGWWRARRWLRNYRPLPGAPAP